MTKNLPNGLQIEDVMVGVGKEAVPGRRVTVHYSGTFPSGKKFDSGRNFTFRLGQSQVIKGNSKSNYSIISSIRIQNCFLIY